MQETAGSITAREHRRDRGLGSRAFGQERLAGDRLADERDALPLLDDRHRAEPEQEAGPRRRHLDRRRVGPSGDQMRAIGWPFSTCSPGSTSPSRSPLTGALVWSRRPLPSVVRSSSAPRAS